MYLLMYSLVLNRRFHFQDIPFIVNVKKTFYSLAITIAQKNNNFFFHYLL